MLHNVSRERLHHCKDNVYERFIQDLFEYFQELGFLFGGERAKARSGRPRDPGYDWAFKQIEVLGRPNIEVYNEWLKINPDQVELLVNPLKSFKNAINYRRKGRKGRK
jgi:hypothetical protein